MDELLAGDLVESDIYVDFGNGVKHRIGQVIIIKEGEEAYFNLFPLSYTKIDLGDCHAQDE